MDQGVRVSSSATEEEVQSAWRGVAMGCTRVKEVKKFCHLYSFQFSDCFQVVRQPVENSPTPMKYIVSSARTRRYFTKTKQVGV